jgi:hypothetical protein
LRELPTLDDISIIVWQRGDESRGIEIPKAVIAGGQGGVSIDLGSDKGKDQAAPKIVLSDTEVSSKEVDVPLQRKMRSVCSGGSTASGPPCWGSRLLGWPPGHSQTRAWQR